MAKQLGLGWGKGRRVVIKTTIAGEALRRALEKQQRWVEQHTPSSSPATIDHHVTRSDVTDTKYFTKARRWQLRMAKARLRARLP